MALVLTALPSLERAVPRQSVWSAGRAGVSGSKSETAAAEPELAKLLSRRGSAVVRHDRSGYAATQVARARTPAVTRLVALPWVRWSYAITGVVAGPSADELVVEADLGTRLRGETTDAVTRERIVVRRSGATWRVSSESATQGVPLWDLGALTWWSGRRVLVVGIGVGTGTLRAFGAIADRVVPDVVSVWGRDWSQRAVVLVPSSQALLARALGQEPSSLEGFAAVTTTGGGAAGPLRVWTNTPSFSTLSDLGREVVLRHEITHVASDAPASTTTPVWLEEGFAEFVGYRGSGIPQPVALADLVRAARAGRPLHAAPAYADFHGPDVAVSYEAAELACALVAERAGTPGLVRFYRLTAAGTGTPDANAAAALHAVTGWRMSAFDRLWRARVARLAG